MENLKKNRGPRSTSSSSDDVPLTRLVGSTTERRATRAPSCSSDEVLFISATVNQDNKMADINDLRFQRLVTCEFCEEVFLNRYGHIVHNASHIIIPLSRYNILQCKVCSEQCHSQRKLRNHMKKKHPNVNIIHANGKANIFTNESKIVKWESRIASLTADIAKQESHITKLESIVGKGEPIFIHLESKRHCESIRSDIKDEINLSNEDKVIEISDSDDDVIENGVLDDADVKNDSIINSKHKEVSPMKLDIPCIRDRLKFEEDVFCPETPDMKGSDLIQDLTSECKINMDLEPPWRALKRECEEDSGSVHYDELVSPMKVHCRLCRREFPNRYKAIRHESSHITVTKGRPFLCRYCDWYISDNGGYLSAHVRRKHPTNKQDPDAFKIKQTQPVKCDKCNLRYICQNKHNNNYHNAESYNPKLENGELRSQLKNGESAEQDGGKQDVGQDGGQFDAQNGVQIKFNNKIQKICDLCYSFLRYGHANLNFTIIGEHCEVGNRLCCDKCGRECFELKLIQIRTRSVYGAKHAPKIKNNYDRLKNIKNRLKMMKSL